MKQEEKVDHMALQTWKTELDRVFSGDDRRWKLAWKDAGRKMCDFRVGKLFAFSKAKNFMVGIYHISFFKSEFWFVRMRTKARRQLERKSYAR
jgi:hypothetical protein